MDGCAERRAPPGHTKTRPRPARPRTTEVTPSLWFEKVSSPTHRLQSPRTFSPAQAHGPLCSRKETPIEGPPVGRGSAPPLTARPGAASLAGVHVAIARVDRGQPCSSRLSQLGARPRRSIPGEGSAAVSWATPACHNSQSIRVSSGGSDGDGGWSSCTVLPPRGFSCRRLATYSSSPEMWFQVILFIIPRLNLPLVSLVQKGCWSLFDTY